MQSVSRKIYCFVSGIVQLDEVVGDITACPSKNLIDDHVGN